MSNEFATVLVALALLGALASFVASEKRRRAAKRKLETWRRGVEDWPH